MQTLNIVFRGRKYKLIALDSAGMGMLAGWAMFGYSYAYMYKIAREHPRNIRIEKGN